MATIVEEGIATTFIPKMVSHATDPDGKSFMMITTKVGYVLMIDVYSQGVVDGFRKVLDEIEKRHNGKPGEVATHRVYQPNNLKVVPSLGLDQGIEFDGTDGERIALLIKDEMTIDKFIKVLEECRKKMYKVGL